MPVQLFRCDRCGDHFTTLTEIRVDDRTVDVCDECLEDIEEQNDGYA